MAGSTTNLEQIDSSQAQNTVTANNLFDAASPATFGGRHAEACAGLTWGFYGGRWGGLNVLNGTLALAPNTTNFLVSSRLTGAVFRSEGSPNLWDDTANYARLYKVFTATLAVTSYEDWRTGPDGVSGGGVGGSGGPVEVQLACSDLTTALSTGTNKGFVVAPCDFDLTSLWADLLVASTSGVVTIDVNVGGLSILSTKLTVDATELSSRTAALPYVLATSGDTLLAGQRITIDIDGAGTGAKGLVITLGGTRA